MVRRVTSIVLAASAVAISAGAQQQISDARAVAPDASIRIFNLVGSVRVSGWDTDSIAVSGTVAPGGGRFYLGAGEQTAKLGVDVPPGQKSRGPSHLEVRVPRGSRVWIKTETATVEVAGVEGGLDVNSVSGSLHVTGQPRQLYAETMDGAITIDGAARWVRAKTASGALTLRGRSDDVAATTVSGRIDVSGGPFLRARFESVTGDIRFEGTLDRGGSFDFESHTGVIELVLPAGVDAEVTVTSFQGKIENRLTEAKPRPSAGGRGTELVFTAGRGGAQLVVRSFKGIVRLLPGY